MDQLVKKKVLVKVYFNLKVKLNESLGLFYNSQGIVLIGEFVSIANNFIEYTCFQI